MSNLVAQIRSSFESIVATELPTYTELQYKVEVDQNNFKNNTSRYGIVPLGMSEVAGVVRSVTVDQTFQLILTTDFVNRDSDASQIAAAEELFDKHEEVYKLVSFRKAGLPSIVLVVTLDTIEEPEYLVDDNVVALRANYTVKYRSNI